MTIMYLQLTYHRQDPRKFGEDETQADAVPDAVRRTYAGRDPRSTEDWHCRRFYQSQYLDLRTSDPSMLGRDCNWWRA